MEYGSGWGGWPTGYRTMAIGSTVSGAAGGGSVENERMVAVVMAVVAVVVEVVAVVAAGVAAVVGGSGEAMGSVEIGRAHV